LFKDFKFNSHLSYVFQHEVEQKSTGKFLCFFGHLRTNYYVTSCKQLNMLSLGD